MYNVLYNDKIFPLLGHTMSNSVQLTLSFFMGYNENADFFLHVPCFMLWVSLTHLHFAVILKNCCINVYNIHSL